MDKTNSIKIFPIFLILSFVCVLFLSIGYAQVTYDLNVEGDISLRSQQGVVIKRVDELLKKGKVQYKNENYVGTLLTSKLTLDSDLSSFLILKIEVENNSDQEYQFSEISYDVQNELNLYSNPQIVPQILTQEDINSILEGQEALEIGEYLSPSETAFIYLKYHYQDVMNHDDYQNLEGMIHFVFDEVYSIEYQNFNSLNHEKRKGNEEVLVSFQENIANLEIQNLEGVLYVQGEDYYFYDNQLFIPALKESIVIKNIKES